MDAEQSTKRSPVHSPKYNQGKPSPKHASKTVQNSYEAIIYDLLGCLSFRVLASLNKDDAFEKLSQNRVEYKLASHMMKQIYRLKGLERAYKELQQRQFSDACNSLDKFLTKLLPQVRRQNSQMSMQGDDSKYDSKLGQEHLKGSLNENSIDANGPEVLVQEQSLDTEDPSFAVTFGTTGQGRSAERDDDLQRNASQESTGSQVLASSAERRNRPKVGPMKTQPATRDQPNGFAIHGSAASFGKQRHGQNHLLPPKIVNQKAERNQKKVASRGTSSTFKQTAEDAQQIYSRDSRGASQQRSKRETVDYQSSNYFFNGNNQSHSREIPESKGEQSVVDSTSQEKEEQVSTIKIQRKIYNGQQRVQTVAPGKRPFFSRQRPEGVSINIGISNFSNNQRSNERLSTHSGHKVVKSDAQPYEVNSFQGIAEDQKNFEYSALDESILNKTNSKTNSQSNNSIIQAPSETKRMQQDRHHLRTRKAARRPQPYKVPSSQKRWNQQVTPDFTMTKPYDRQRDYSLGEDVKNLPGSSLISPSYTAIKAKHDTPQSDQVSPKKALMPPIDGLISNSDIQGVQTFAEKPILFQGRRRTDNNIKIQEEYPLTRTIDHDKSRQINSSDLIPPIQQAKNRKFAIHNRNTALANDPLLDGRKILSPPQNMNPASKRLNSNPRPAMRTTVAGASAIAPSRPRPMVLGQSFVQRKHSEVVPGYSTEGAMSDRQQANQTHLASKLSSAETSTYMKKTEKVDKKSQSEWLRKMVYEFNTMNQLDSTTEARRNIGSKGGPQNCWTTTGTSNNGFKIYGHNDTSAAAAFSTLQAKSISKNTSTN